MCGPKQHPSLVCMCKHQGVELLYGNIRTLCHIKAAQSLKRSFEKEIEISSTKIWGVRRQDFSLIGCVDFLNTQVHPSPHSLISQPAKVWSFPLNHVISQVNSYKHFNLIRLTLEVCQ